MNEAAIKVLIVDDEPLSRKRIRRMLEKYPEMNIVGESPDGFDAINNIQRLVPDLVFLDVQMPGADGLAVVKNQNLGCQPLFIFVTAYSSYGLSAFDVHAVDYLLKPFDEIRFEKAVNRAKSRLTKIHLQQKTTDLQNLVSNLFRESEYLKQIAIRANSRIFLVKVEKIDQIQAERNNVRLYVGEETHIWRETIGNLESKLDPSVFRRIHRSAIINLNSIKELQTAPGGEYKVILNNGANLVLTRTYQKNLQEFLG